MSGPRLFRKKPVVIEAIRYLPGQTCAAVAEFMGIEHHEDYCWDDAEWLIPTLEGDMVAQPGDWIIKGIQGEFYPCKPDIFDATYEQASAGRSSGEAVQANKGMRTSDSQS